MDKNAIKKYAVWARRELIARVSQRAALYEITDMGYGDASNDSVLGRVMSAEEKRQRQALIAQIREKGYEQVMEEIAYTWFNRFAALRFMEVNGYLPSHVRVFTDDENSFKPQILAEAINMELDGLDMEKVYALKNANDDDELFKYLIIVQCNALSSILPGMFQRISDYTELLLPDNLLREGSVIEQMVAQIPEEDWTDQVQIIGWLYQYYNTEPKDKVFADLKKNIKIRKETIPAATQQFTPDWIVRYMVENALGRLWLESHPNEELKASWKYYLDDAEQAPEVQSQLAESRAEYNDFNPEDILALDPCQGSGHILAYMFDVLVQIYESYGYTSREAAASIIEHNIWGLDIDDRASQLAYFSVMMKARQYDRRFFGRGIQPHVFSIPESNGIDTHTLDYFVGGDSELRVSTERLISAFHDAKEYGSIIKLSQVDTERIKFRLEEIENESVPSLYSVQAVEQLKPIVNVAQVLLQKYHVVITNPPYMGGSGMSAKLSDYVKNEYPDTKSDMSTVFMERTIGMCCKNGYMAMINIPVWMFLSSYEKLRNRIIHENTFINMLHFGRGVFGSDFGTTAFTIKKMHVQGYSAEYRKLFERQGSVDSLETKERWFFEGKGRFFEEQESFLEIPGTPIAYSLGKKLLSAFASKRLVSTIGDVKQGLATGDNNRFLRLWFEVDKSRICFTAKDSDEALRSACKWFPYNKGGAYRKWYGNVEYVVNWENDGFEIKNIRDEKGKIRSRPQNLQYFFRESLTWSKVTIGGFSMRYVPTGAIFDVAGCSLFPYGNYMSMLANMNSCVQRHILSVFSQSVNYEVGQIAALPMIDLADKEDEISGLAKKCVALSKDDWDSFENSWDFSRHPLLNGCSTIQESFSKWAKVCEARFSEMKTAEEKINELLIGIYGLEGEVFPDVNPEEVTVRRADLQREIRSLISYAVGCMFGRYSLDTEGITYAGSGWDISKYRSFIPDKDGIIPICDDEYFEDDIVGKFVDFIKTAFGEVTLEENLAFVASVLGGNGHPRDIIRSYFLNDFYNDHCAAFSVTGSGKRPIYWLFDSGKKNGFKCLIYMHRYQADTIARIRTDYVHEQQSRYRTAIADLEVRIANSGTSERVKLSKQMTKLREQADELRAYEERIHHLADQMIRIDLDDGFKYNYELFRDVVAKVK